MRGQFRDCARGQMDRFSGCARGRTDGFGDGVSGQTTRSRDRTGGTFSGLYRQAELAIIDTPIQI
ncbi:hypothetical protein CCR94_14180 [Rhodoblastus sphagnicola]|uniref:Uncharacterized protein n=1 Tax=Rhodoblastus sphagnicola TaxID=333368 RepID=A0A2S6N5A2_9HYPH|nr:hypothetical protein CCR94_14180 [Rhodoblastus sphagnicola]